MTNLTLSELLAQDDVSVEPVGQSSQRPLFARLQHLGGRLKVTSTQMLLVVGVVATSFLAPTDAHAFGEFQPDVAVAQSDEGAFKMDLSALDSKLSAPPFVQNAQKTERQGSAPASAWPKFKSSKDVEAYFLDPERGNNLFAALATRMENLVTTVYPDPATGRNVGIGYNMDAIGMGQAKQDFARIGMKKEHINILVSQNAAQYSKVHITPNQAVSLLILLQPRYEAVAKEWIGAKHWGKMDTNQQAAITYLAYQTGGNIDQFRSAKQLIQSDKDTQAQKHLVTYYKDGSGEWQRNDRFAKHVGSMWQSPQAYAKQVGHTQMAEKWSQVAKGKTTDSTVVAKEDSLDDLIAGLQKNSPPPDPANQLDALGQKLKSMFGNNAQPARAPSMSR